MSGMAVDRHTVGINTTQDCKDIVGKEALLIQHGGHHLGDGANGHFLGMLKLVPGHAGGDMTHEGHGVGIHATGRQNSGWVELEGVGLVATVDFVALRLASVACNQTEIVSCDGHGRSRCGEWRSE